MVYLILGAGMMGRAIAFDLLKHSKENIITVDKDREKLHDTKVFLNERLKAVTELLVVLPKGVYKLKEVSFSRKHLYAQLSGELSQKLSSKV